MLALTIISGIVILAIIGTFIFGEKQFLQEYWLRLVISLVLLIGIFTFTLTLELNAKNKLEVIEKTIVVDYFEINIYTTIEFEEPTKIKVVEYNYPGYSLLNDDKTVYEVMK